MAEVTLWNGDSITQGDAVQANLTLNTDGAATDLTGDTLTCSLTHNGNEVVADHSVTLVTPASGIVRLALTNTDTASLPAGEIKGDIKAATLQRHFGPFRFTVRRAIT